MRIPRAYLPRRLWRARRVETANDRIGDVLGVSRDAVNHRRRKSVKEMQSHKVEPRLALDDTAHLNRLAMRVSGDRNVDPFETGMETRRPDHVGDLQQSAVVEKRPSVAH